MAEFNSLRLYHGESLLYPRTENGFSFRVTSRSRADEELLAVRRWSRKRNGRRPPPPRSLSWALRMEDIPMYRGASIETRRRRLQYAGGRKARSAWRWLCEIRGFPTPFRPRA